MRILVDTHCWLWCLLSPEKLNRESGTILQDPENEIYLSAASAWEIVIKYRLGKLEIPLKPSEYIPARLTALGHSSLPIEQKHVLAVGQLPDHHQDPFDRILVAQAQVEGMTLVTADKLLDLYDIPIIWAGRGRRRPNGERPSDAREP